eukprot:CAMPEP_0175056056 /NCGR_PEP_ID=MMETSP0052_2-20121109/10445_1 /TAXON_ID=51329 ORGANISM="Polytomella parva, Strain SAG 63-3" /NCGR_SAMPLE_ID=MMETSP0052_2 /ASSEMBLY_ACC=CAM_ASM_000194 /LENGTH=343 /DNA_ID=CAMNT_0016321013 /DNA_START=456 /DNA_END=1484 /DNA_ORIENTATION=+
MDSSFLNASMAISSNNFCPSAPFSYPKSHDDLTKKSAVVAVDQGLRLEDETVDCLTYDDGSDLVLVSKGGMVFAYDISYGSKPGSQEQLKWTRQLTPLQPSLAESPAIGLPATKANKIYHKMVQNRSNNRSESSPSNGSTSAGSVRHMRVSLDLKVLAVQRGSYELEFVDLESDDAASVPFHRLRVKDPILCFFFTDSAGSDLVVASRNGLDRFVWIPVEGDGKDGAESKSERARGRRTGSDKCQGTPDRVVKRRDGKGDGPLSFFSPSPFSPFSPLSPLSPLSSLSPPPPPPYSPNISFARKRALRSVDRIRGMRWLEWAQYTHETRMVLTAVSGVPVLGSL